MSRLPLRKEKNCLNCGHFVKERFCPNCGQENAINRPSFHYLFTHFAGDLVHYDSGFWKTMRTLLFKPGRIIRDYLDGKRKTYMPPVKLYIFMSFVAFFLPHILPSFSDKDDVVKEFQGIEVAGYENVTTVEKLDSIQKILPENEKLDSLELEILKSIIKSRGKNGKSATDKDEISFKSGNKYELKRTDEEGFTFNEDYKNIKTTVAFDSIHESLSRDKKMNRFYRPMARKLIELDERGLYDEHKLSREFENTFIHNLPKVLFFYLPVFAFLLWLFHSKKKWLYYDHGIFTLYYFSFLLILTVVNILLNWMLLVIDNYMATDLTNYIGFPFFLLTFGYAFFYFFRSHSRVYQERKLISRTKSFLLFWLNTLFVMLILSGYTILTFMLI